MAHGKMVISFFLVFLILSSPAHAAFKGNLADVKLTLTPEDYSIANRDNESMYALLRFQIKGDLAMTSEEDINIRASWDSQPDACKASSLSYTISNSAYCVSFTSTPIYSTSDVQWTIRGQGACTGKVWLHVYDGFLLDPCLQILLNVEVSAPPGPPAETTGVKASDGEYEDFVYITWEKVPHATWYEIYRGFGSKQPIVNTTSLYYFDETVEPWKKYKYYVSACNKGGCSYVGQGDEGYRDPAVEDVYASDGVYLEYVEIIWTSVKGAKWYEVWRNDELLDKIVGELLYRDYMDNVPDEEIWEKYNYSVKACAALDECSKPEDDEGYRGQDESTQNRARITNTIINLILLLD